MLDFVKIKVSRKRGECRVIPDFIVSSHEDLMTRGRAFYAIWDEEKGLWETDESKAATIIDRDIRTYVQEHNLSEDMAEVLYLNEYSSGQWDKFQKYCKGLSDRYFDLDNSITFQNQKVKKEDWVSKRVPYILADGPCDAYEELISTLYEPEERKKLEWAIGCVISGDSVKVQKFLVMYGEPGSGKSTVLHIIEKLFEGYWTAIYTSDLTSGRNNFALETFRSNPLVGIEHEGKLGRIEDNTLLNSLVSHEVMTVNEKFKSTYKARFRTFLFLATNEPVRITDAKSGIIRRLIDVYPSGNKIPNRRYNSLVKQISYELGAIAAHCLEVYRSLGATYYDNYIPKQMISETNDFFNFIDDNFEFFGDENPDGVSLNTAWLRYKDYCEDAKISFPFTKRRFKAELMAYFEDFSERHGQTRNWYSGFKTEKFVYRIEPEVKEEPEGSWLIFSQQDSLFDKIFADCPAQYASGNGAPKQQWAKITTRLADIDTRKLHYIRVPRQLVVIDFDKKDADGNKSFELNVEAASKWPPTYAELSKSGAGIHLHYYYEGDVEQLSRIFDEDIEIKVSVGNSALRRKLSKCNNIDILTLSSGLPLKGAKKMLDKTQIESEQKLRALIRKALRKEIHGHTKPEIDFIHYILEQAYNSDLKYDVRDMRNAVQAFALKSSHQADYCLRTVSKMEFCSNEQSENLDKTREDAPIIFFDVEVFPNLFLIVWKKHGAENVVRLFNPSPSDVEELTKMRLVGFNNRKYDNHMLYARMMGYTEQQIFDLSNRIINDEDGRRLLFGEAYNLSYTDIYDFLSAGNKMSLKKWEIKLGIHHHELGIPFDQPIPESRWEEAADYCGDDVLAAEALFDSEYGQGDWMAREMLALIAGMTVNDTTNQLTTRIIIGRDKHAKEQFVHTDLSTIFPGYEYSAYGISKDRYREGAKIVNGKSIYRGEDPGEGGRVFATPGIFYNVPVLDIASMHPHSAIALNVFGKYTKRLEALVEARVAIKHKDFAKAKELLIDILPSRELADKLDEYLNDPAMAKAIANALKTAINSVYGLTSAKFDNAMKDPRNKDNIVAKYGALFMMNLQKEVEDRGFTVVHIKTDSIKIANGTPEIIEFVQEYGRKYGFTFEHESTYRKMCLVNEAVYIAQYESAEVCMDRYGYVPEKNAEEGEKWTATGAQFQVPYVFKTLFSKEPLIFEDTCETKSVTTTMYLDMNEDLPEGQHDYRFVGKVGLFCPIKPGKGGGALVRQDKDDKDKFNAVTGTKKKGSNDIYRWLEAETVKTCKLEDAIDTSYYRQLIDDAIDTINEFGDFWSFVYGEGLPMPNEFMNIPEDVDEMPFN